MDQNRNGWRNEGLKRDMLAFAKDVLQHLESADEWGADTLDTIANTAVGYGLAEPASAMFRRTQRVVRS